VHPVFVPLAAAILSGTEIRVGTVVGFPLGANFPEAKAYEARLAVERGAVEIDMVMNIGALKGGDHRRVVEDIRAVVESAGEGARVKVILETGLLTDEEKVAACELSREAGAHFVKTSTGFAGGGATVPHVELMRRSVSSAVQVKASGGVRGLDAAIAMLEAGATRLGTSASATILGELRARAAGGVATGAEDSTSY